ncbi:MAG: ATP-binding cassette domain-containing protein, partial [Nitriliruptorales bacterium]|nr:ATP-binding cassette domain-containing protein [Nitriliruptorales bacterium]
MPSGGGQVVIQDLTIRFHGGVEATRGVTFRVRPGELVTIIGPSGCGKSTVLNAVASLIPPDQAEVTGSILVGGEDVVPRAGGKTA